MPSQLLTIGDFAFANCTSITDIDFPDGLEYIGDSAFSDNRVRKIILPDSILEISERAFQKAYNLRAFIIYAVEPPPLGPWAFTNMHESFKIYVPDQSLEDYKITEFWTNFAYRTFSISDIDANGFVIDNNDVLIQYLGDAVDVEVPSTVTGIEGYAFAPSTIIQSITIGESVEEINANAFSECMLLEDIFVSLDNSFYESDDGVLYGKDNTLISYPINKKNLSYIIKSGTQGITTNAFISNDYLESLTIPDTITYIEENAFNGCNSLVDIYVLAESPATLDNASFNEIESDYVIYVPAQSLDEYIIAWAVVADKIQAIT